MGEEDEEAYKKQFSRYIKNGINPDGIEAIYKKAHAAIRADPVREAQKDKKVTKKRRTDKKLTSEARKQKVKDQKEEFLRWRPSKQRIDTPLSYIIQSICYRFLSYFWNGNKHFFAGFYKKKKKKKKKKS